MDWYPLRFQPIYKERVWGGRRLAGMYGRQLPTDDPVGESWEITDRPEGVSVIAEGSLKGRTLADVMAADAPGLLGDATSRQGRFPLLAKILDARDVLSLQVHPPVQRAAELGGDSKTEMWYFTAADPGSEILVGLRNGADQTDFERRLLDGSVAECVQRLPVRAGDAMFLPSGRVHALGAGLVLFEIQENSDTTYRVFDWNRVGLDGKPRPLHIRESLASIDFADHEPRLIDAAWRPSGSTSVRPLVQDPCFNVEVRRAPGDTQHRWNLTRCAIVALVSGQLELCGGLRDRSGPATTLNPGDFCLLPAGIRQATLHTTTAAEWIVAEPGSS